MRGIVFSFLLFLGACAVPNKGIEVRTVEVPRTITEKCVKKEDVPEQPALLRKTKIPDDLETALSVALAKVSELERYGNKMAAIVSGCY